MFEDHDFLNVSEICQLYLSNSFIVENFLNIDINDYMDLIPDDIKKLIIDRVHNSSYQENINPSEEELIINAIYTITKLIELNPKLLTKTSETELSDHIFNSLFLPMNNSGLSIAREMPAGYANKTVGELDFCIYSQKNNVFKIIAVGENKEWGNYERAVKQLFGYMNKDSGFGFSILFNKTTQLQTITRKRKAILENFCIKIQEESYFELVKYYDEPYNLKDVIMTTHKSPETDRLFKVFHFIVNGYSPERYESAKQARSK